MTEQNMDHARVMAPPPLVFLGYLIGALILNWVVPFRVPWTFAVRLGGGAMVILGFLLGVSAIAQMRRAHTSPDPRESVTALVTNGPYRFTRNPMYLGFFLIHLGFTFLAGTWWGLIVSPFLLWTVTYAVIHAEEIYLEGKFGGMYREYHSRAGRWI
jgi:protein-S-isoprenylcysteine O-methyltransferase Ste14